MQIGTVKKPEAFAEIVLVYRNSVFNSPIEGCLFVNDKLPELSYKEGYCSVALSGTSRLVSLGLF